MTRRYEKPLFCRVSTCGSPALVRVCVASPGDMYRLASILQPKAARGFSSRMSTDGSIRLNLCALHAGAAFKSELAFIEGETISVP